MKINNVAKKIRKTISVPPDKSITHRILILSSIANNKSSLRNLLRSEDTLRTFKILETLGTSFEGDFSNLEVSPKKFDNGYYELYAGNSGTTARLLIGLLASSIGKYFIYGDRSLNKRPMDRIIYPLELMGANIVARKHGLLPLHIEGRKLKYLNYQMPLNSAQVKSSILLAALHSSGCMIVERRKTRDHTERLMYSMGADISVNNKKIVLNPSELAGINYNVPGDFSSAMYFIVFCLLHPDCKLKILNVGLNPTRTSALEVLTKMGGQINVRVREGYIEPVGDIEIFSSKLNAIKVDLSIYPNLIDEVPLFAIMAPFIEGEMCIINAESLRVKESDRIYSVVSNLRNLSIVVREYRDGFSINGPQKINSGVINTYFDHRIEMAFSILSSLTDANVIINNPSTVAISYPNFYNDLYNIIS